MTALTLLLLSAALGFALSRWTGLPSIPILLLAGMGVAALYPMEPGFVEDAITLGVIFLVFVAGIELNPSRLRGRGQPALQVGSIQFLVLGLLGLGAALVLGFTLETALYIALALTASSTLVVVKLLQERRMLFEPVGRLVTGVLLLQDLLIILLIPVVTRFPEGTLSVLEGLGGTTVLIVLAGVLFRWVAPWMLDRVAFEEETLLLLSLSLLFAFLGLASLLGLPLISGAFLAGVVLSGFPAAALVRGQLNSLGDFFYALLFAALGAFLSLPSPIILAQAVFFIVLVLIVTPPLVAWIAERAGFSARPALSSGLLLAQTSEFSLIIALQGLSLGHLSPEVFTLITLVTVSTMILTPAIAGDRVTWALMRVHPFRKTPTMDPRPRGHILLLGCGRHGQELLESLIVTREELIVVDDDPALVAHLRQAGVRAVKGDVSDRDLLQEVGAPQARVIISTIRRLEDNEPALEMAKGVPFLVRGFNQEDGEWIRRRGGRPVLYSEAAIEDFQEWYREVDPP